MSQLIKDENRSVAQCCFFPPAASTTVITLTTASTSVSSAALPAGIYRVVCSADTYLASGVGAAVAAATDMLIPAKQIEHYYINQGDAVAGFSTTAGATVTLTRMP